MEKQVYGVAAEKVSASKCSKHLRFGALLDVEMLQECTALLREADFELKMQRA